MTTMLPRSIHLGMKGKAVSELQLALSNNGAGELVGKIDGDFGPKTLAAVKHFQAGNNLVVDGIAGPITLKAIGLSHLVEGAPPEGIISLKPYTLPWYEEMYRIMTFDRGYETQIASAAKRVGAGKDRYVALVNQNFPSIPWYFVALVHDLECGCNWKGVLHNGQLFVGTDRKTTIVPIGRGPFATWEAAAIDAIRMEGFDRVVDWSIGNTLRSLEAMNGRGYQQYRENTPYLWACSSINDGTGKYIADGVYDSNADANTQVGSATVLKQLEIQGLVDV